MLPLARPRLRYTIAVLTATWLSAILLGFWSLVAYDFTPVEQPAPAAQWPADSLLHRRAGRRQLLVFMHPRCSCSQATLMELADLLGGRSDATDVHVVFCRPSALDAQWARSNLWRAAERIAGVSVSEDVDGAEALRFGATTSGQLLMYDGAGALVGACGITPGRGQRGACPGAEAVVDWLAQRTRAVEQSDVFGCPLFNDGAIALRQRKGSR